MQIQQKKEQQNQWQTIEITISPPSQQLKKQLALIAKVLSVDKQLNPQTLTKKIVVLQNKDILIQFKSKDLKLLRSVVNGLFKHMDLVTKTIIQFDPQNQNQSQK